MDNKENKNDLVCFAGCTARSKVYVDRILYSATDNDMNGMLVFNINWDNWIMSISKLEEFCYEFKDIKY